MTTRVSPGMRAKLASLGLDPAQLGKTFNSATAPALDFAVPDDPGKLGELLGDTGKMEKIIRAGKLDDVIQAHIRNTFNKHQDLSKQIDEGVQAGIARFMKDQEEQHGAAPRVPISGAANHTGTGRSSKNTIHNPMAMGAKLDDEFKGPLPAADYFKLIWHKNQNRDAKAQAQLDRVRNAFSSSEPSGGGFLIPEVLRAEMLAVALETAIVRSRARVIPMDSLTVPFPMVDATSNASSVFGGIVAYWTEEAAQLTQSSATFGRVVLTAKKLTCYTEVPNELLSDSGQSFQALIDQIFPEALAWYEDIAFLNGSGVGEPLGVLNAGNTAMVTVAAEAGQPSTSIVWENLVNMFARMLPASLNRAVWLVSPNTFPELATMALSVGTGGSAVWLNNGVDGPPATILGRPVIITEKAKPLGQAGDVSFVDFGFYLIGDRQTMTATSSEHYKFGSDVTAYKIVERVDGQPWLPTAITPQNGGPTLSPFVQLAARP